MKKYLIIYSLYWKHKIYLSIDNCTFFFDSSNETIIKANNIKDTKCNLKEVDFLYFLEHSEKYLKIEVE